MSANTSKEDLRRIKTERALNVAIYSLMENRKFEKVTVSDICEKALISRATFYAHFDDKYDLLKVWMINLVPQNLDINNFYEQTEKTVNLLVYDNKAVIKNLVNDADNETLEILFNFMISILNFPKPDNKKTNPQNIVLASFFGGGMMYYLTWQARNNFPPDVAPMNIYLCEIIKQFQDWKQE